MIKIQKNKDWFLISENKWGNWAIETCQDNADFSTFSKEKKCKNMVFDWPWEYEKNWIEIVWTEISDKWTTAYMWKIDWRNILAFPWNLEWFKNEKFDKIDEEADIFVVNILEETDINILTKAIEQSEAKIVVFSWNIERLKDKFSNIQAETELKISTIPEDKTEYYSL